MKSDKCQLHTVPSMAEPLNYFQILWQFRNRLKRMVKGRIYYVANVIRRTRKMNHSPFSMTEKRTGFQPGERVRIKSKEKIQQTLDNWNELKGCGFMEEMWPYCGTEQKILKRAERFFDERDYRLKKVRGIYLLEGLMCQGTRDLGPCDRSCFFFWREEWLEKERENA